VDWALKSVDGNIKNDHSDKTSIEWVTNCNYK